MAQQTPPKFFITYSHQDSEFARRLTDDLRANGLDGFFDAYSIRAGDDFAKRIAHGLEECDVYVPVLSPAALESPWCEREINAAIALSMERGRGGRPRIVPVICKACRVPVLLRSLLYVDFVGRYDNALDELLTKGFLLETRPPVSSEAVRPESEFRPSNIPRQASSPDWSRIVGWAVILITLLIVGIWGFPLAIKLLAPTPTATPWPTPAPPTRIPPTATKVPTVVPTQVPGVAPTAVYGIGSTKISADGATMVYVPAGDFTMGSNDDDSEKPPHTVYLNAFWIDKLEVTNALYKKCVDAGKCSPPSDSTSYTRSSYYGNTQFNDYPVIYVPWDDATKYCTFASKKLPTEAQWEKAARGTDGRIFPWGSQWDVQTTRRLNFSDKNDRSGPPTDAVADDGYGDTAPVGSYPAGASPYGVMDMVGNVREWVADWYSKDYYASSPRNNPTGPASGQYRVERGGSWNAGVFVVRATFREGNSPGRGIWSIGFRCAE